MALKKNYQTGTKYYYARVGNIIFDKNENENILITTIEFKVKMYERDSVLKSQEEYDALTSQEKSGWVLLNTDPNEYEKSWKMIASYDVTISSADNVSEFYLNTLSQADNNIIKACYTYMRNHIDLCNETEWTNC